MKQLLIVNSAKNLNAGATYPTDLSGLQAGAICFFELGGSSFLSAAPTKNFGIALGRSNGQKAMVIPEVDIHTLEITKAMPIKGVHFRVVVALGTTTADKVYTLRFFKKGVAPHERNSWTVSIVAGTTNASPYKESLALKKVIDDKQSNDFNFTVTTSTTNVTIEAADWTDWTVYAEDDMTSNMLTITNRIKPIGDKAYIQDLASQCAAGKGFEHTAPEGREFIPGYPEAVEDIQLNDSGNYVDGSTAAYGKYSTRGYSLYTLRFQVGRDSAKTRDEKVWQIVHIAVPLNLNSGTDNTTLDAILPVGKFEDNMMTATATAKITEMVKEASLN